MKRRECLHQMLGAAFLQAADAPFRTYRIESERQAYSNSLRVIDAPRDARRKRVLFVLPVNADISQRWGDGFETVLRLGLHAKHGMAVAAPSFSAWPWYADHPTNPKIRQESYFIEEVVPFVERLFPGHQRLLVGFSKSGNGAYQLLLRHPRLFHAAAAWDAPLMKEAPDQYEMGDIFGTRENFARYAIPRLLEKRAPELRGKPARLGLMGYDAFLDHTRRAHEMMELLRIPHYYDNSVRRVHRWDTGWLEGAVEFLAGT